MTRRKEERISRCPAAGTRKGEYTVRDSRESEEKKGVGVGKSER